MIDIYKYDDNNVFAKILRNQIPCKKVYEDKICLAFERCKKEGGRTFEHLC